MYRVDNDKIGEYLGKTIAGRFESDRQFAIAYLRLRNHEENPAPDEIGKMQNKICQIKKGNKGIQIQDLPYFSELLAVSVDDILSGGTFCRPATTRLTNYSIAFSKDPKEWEEYIRRPDKLILYSDEYGKTVIDYALEFKNLDFLKYLMEKKYIWFVSKDPNEYWGSFGAGTSIERRTFQNTNLLDIKIKECDELRTNLITLAIENKDFELLDELRAREIPSYYEVYYSMNSPMDFKKYYNRSMIEAIAGSDDKVLVYFSQEYEIHTNRKGICKYTYPFLGELLDLLIKNNRKVASRMLKNALKHNKTVLTGIRHIGDLFADGFNEAYRKNIGLETMKAQIMNNYRFFKENDTVCFHTAMLLINEHNGIFSNVIRVRASSKNEYINSLIEDVNESYRQIAEYEYETEG